MIDKHMFRAYDVRGDVETQLTEESTREIGKALGVTHFEADATVCVGRDARESSPRLSAQLIDGMLSQGINVVDIGQVTTPMLYFALEKYGVDGGIMVTGSHNPIGENGLKMCKGKRSFLREDIASLYEAIVTGRTKADGARRGILETRDISASYAEEILRRVRCPRKLRLVLDAGNGVAGPMAARILSHYASECVELYCEPDGRFPNHHPDPSVAANMRDCARKVVETGADLGLAFDGDGDRLGVVDRSGEIMASDRLLVLLARDVLRQAPGAAILGDVKCSKFTFDAISKAGGAAEMSKTGHAFIKAKMRDSQAALAGEVSGHFFFAENWYGFDDAIYAAARVCRIVSESDKGIGELLSDLPKSYATPELRIECADEAKFSITDRILNYYSRRYPTSDLDGARIDFPSGWALVRASNTQPVLVVRVEADSHESAQSLCDDLVVQIERFAAECGASVDLTCLKHLD